MRKRTVLRSTHPAWCVHRASCEVTSSGDAGHHFTAPTEMPTSDSMLGLSVAQWVDLGGRALPDDVRVRLVRTDRVYETTPQTTDYLTLAEAVELRRALDSVIDEAERLAARLCTG